ncbi:MULTISPECIES: hypothetical protein [Brevibacillus]|uniref:hypothetical protein n=1 Tax=Brevibacillus TaxID=55080 RepID=UPI000240316D|nr:MULTISPECIES: hypothetical protein [Brevibacillus]MBA4532474.1 hypothetical protein [Brevibacillus halotolerans]CCF13577.1 hypothetical protein BLGI_1492 [Brevibacillus laterosporus GI-9]
MKKNRLSALIMSLLLVGVVSVPNGISLAAEKPLNVQIANDEKEFLRMLKNSNSNKLSQESTRATATVANAEKVSVDIMDEKSKFSLKEDEPGNLKYFGVINVDGDKSPVYIKSKDDISDDNLMEIMESALKKFEEKSEKDVEYNTLSTTPSYKLRDRALGITVSNSKLGKFWYTEYRAYYGGSTSKIHQYYLRADHEHMLKGTWDPRLYKFKSTWNPARKSDNIEILNPKPQTSDNKTSIDIGIPGGVSWEVDTGGSIDIETNFSPSKNTVTWDVVNASFLWQDFYVMKDFGFTKGVEIESPKSNNGFDMKVYYKIWHNEPYIGIDYDEYWDDNIIYDERKDDLDFKD